MGYFALGRFALGRFARGSFRPILVDRFAHIFIQALWIEVRYVLVYKGGRGVYGESVWPVYSVSIAYELYIVISSFGAAGRSTDDFYVRFGQPSYHLFEKEMRAHITFTRLYNIT